MVYVHCKGGIGRTGTVAGCYLVRHGQTPEAALRLIAQRLYHTHMAERLSPEGDEQRALVLRWQPGL
jgi:protein-tyrosine phosphatase